MNARWVRISGLLVAVVVIAVAALFIKRVIERSTFKKHVFAVLKSRTKDFDRSLFEQAVKKIADLEEGYHPLPPPYEQLTSDGMVYITDDQAQGRLFLFYLWAGKGFNLHGALHVTEEFQLEKLPVGYQEKRVLNMARPEGLLPSRRYWGPWGIDLKVIEPLAPKWYLVVYDLD